MKPPAVRRLGDTLSYNVGAFKSQSDRTIGDVIAKMPGIEVDSDGGIKYQGKPINSYYVDGLNLMDGRYGLINENLAVGNVVSVEVFENHQPIRILDSLTISEKAAINIRLKKQTVTSYAVHYGLGLSPLLWDVNVTPMLFTRGFQAAGSYQTNNIGRSVRSQLIDHIGSSGINSPIPSATGWLAIPPLPSPAFSSERWLDNNSHIGSVNTLKKTKKGLELKFNAAFTADKIKQNGNSSTLYFVENDTIAFAENVNQLFNYNSFDVDLTVLKNIKTKYFKNQFTVSTEWENSTSNNQRTDVNYRQGLGANGYSLRNNFHSIFNRRGITHNFYSTISANSSTQSLQINAISSDSSASPLQDFKLTTLSANNYVEFTRKVKALSISLKAGNATTLNKVVTQLTDYPGLGTPQNDIDWNSSKTFLTASTTLRNFKDNKWFFRVEVPLSHNYINYTQETTRNFNKIAVEPTLFVRRKINANTNIIGNANYQNTFSRLGDMYDNFVLTNYLSLNRKDNDFRDNQKYQATLGLNYNNAVSLLTGNLNYSYSITTLNIIGNTTLQNDGSSFTRFLNEANASKNHAINARVSKNFIDARLSFAGGASFIRFTNERVVNDQRRTFVNDLFRPFVRLNYSGLSWVDVKYNAAITFMNSQNARTQQRTQTLQLDFVPAKSLLLQTKIEHYAISGESGKNAYLFPDLLIRFTPKNKKGHAIEMQCYNLLNVNAFKTFYVNDFQYSESTYNLRPRQFVVRGRLNI